MDAVFTDFKAAFDTVPHELLLLELHKLDFSESIVAWLKSFISDREIRFKVGLTISPVFLNTSGVDKSVS